MTEVALFDDGFAAPCVLHASGRRTQHWQLNKATSMFAFGTKRAYYGGFAPEVSAFLSIAGSGWHIDNGVHCLRLILGGVFDRFPALQIIVGHNLEILSWMAWRADYSFPPNKNGGLKRTIRE
jgi:predicted TIM-barrel fold metal-dependent hydrolase